MSLQINIVLAIVIDNRRQSLPLKFVLVGTMVMVEKVELDSTLPTIWKMFPYVCDVTQTITDHDRRLFH